MSSRTNRHGALAAWGPWALWQGVSLGRLLRRATAKIIKRQASLQPACFEVPARKLRPTALRCHAHSRSAFLIFLLHPHSNHPKPKKSNQPHTIPHCRHRHCSLTARPFSSIHDTRQTVRQVRTDGCTSVPSRPTSCFSPRSISTTSQTDDEAVTISQGPGGIALFIESVPGHPTLHERKNWNTFLSRHPFVTLLARSLPTTAR